MRVARSLGLLCAALLFSAPAAHAQKPAPKPDVPGAEAGKGKPKAAMDVAPLVTKLDSGDEGQIKSALDDLRIAGASGSAAAPAVAKALGKGLSLPLTEAAIDTLADLENEAGSPVVAQYL